MNEHFRAVGLHAAMFAIPISAAIVSAVLLVATRTVPNDMNNLHAWMSSPADQPNVEVHK